jgi:ectoine hydroxylase-related dioxygenase (phytanoyl-CoA dioxygenase family)
MQNGAVKLEQFYNSIELDKIADAIAEVTAKPSPFKSITKNENGSFFMDYNNWRRFPKLFEVCGYSKTVALLKKLTGSSRCWLFHDHVLIKSGLAPATPWHHDRPYYIFKGDLNLSIWTPLNDVPKGSGMTFLAGSHKSGKLFAPRSFRTGEEIEAKDGFGIITQDVLDCYEKVEFDLKRGDAIVFLNDTIHSAAQHVKQFERASLSVRYLMDGAKMTNNYINATPPFHRMGVEVKEGGAVPEKFFPLLES